MATWRTYIKTGLKSLGLYGPAATALKTYRYREYTSWTRRREPQLPPAKVNQGPLFSIIVPTHKYTARYIEPLLGSLLHQSYPNWQLVVVNACNSAADVTATDQLADRDPRIKVVRLKRNLHISGNTNAGLAAATGEFVCFLDHDDVLADFALAEIAAALATDPHIDVFYSDEDKLTDDARQRFYPFFKPDLVQELILTSSYTCHFMGARTSLLREIGGLRSEFDGAQDYDLMLRLLDRTSRVHHIARMSYHWRMAASSTATVISEKSYAATAGHRALQEHLRRNHIAGTVMGVEGQATAYRVQYPVGRQRVLLLAADPAVFGAHPLSASLQVDLASLAEYPPLANYDAVVVVATGLKPAAPDWLDELVGRALQPETGLVAATVEDRAGISPLGYIHRSGRLHLLEGRIREPEFTYLGLSSWPRAFAAVPTLCYALAGPLAAFHALNPGASDQFELNLRLHQAGRTNVFWPYSRLHRTATAPQLPDSAPIPRWIELPANDPNFNPNLTIRRRRPALKI